MATAGDVEQSGRFARSYARAVVSLRYPIVLGWIGVVAAMLLLPPVDERPSGIDGFVPVDSRAVATEVASLEAFRFPLLSRTVLVQRDPRGLSPYTVARVGVRALALTQQQPRYAKPLVGGLPISNSFRLFPSSSERNTTSLTYLFARPKASLGSQTAAARRLAERELGPDDAYVGVSGSVPARVAQARILDDRLPALETATLVVIVAIVAIYFRSVTAPIVPLAAAGISFYLAVQLAARAGDALGVAVPDELEPLILALVLGIVTDYAIFFISGMRQRLRMGDPTLDAVRATAATTGPIVGVAGLTVAAGTGVLVVAESAFFSAFGPALALAVGVSAIVSLTLVPALLAVLGRGLFWPGRQSSATRSSKLSGSLTRRLVDPSRATLIATGCVVALVLPASALLGIRLGVSFVGSLPQSTETRAAATAAAEGFAAGILSPTVLLAQGEDVTDQRKALEQLGDTIARRPGVAGVIGPGDLVRPLEQRLFLSQEGDDARFLVIFEDAPLGATAIENLRDIRSTLPQLAREAGVQGASYGLGGDTALAAELVERTRDDLGRIAVAALTVNFLLLVLFLRALVAPLFLLASSFLGMTAALGGLTLVFQGFLAQDGITFYVPFASAVLLLSLGSDYNIFGVGYIWERTARMPMREAIASAVPETTSAITVAGVTLAASFGMLAIVPLQPFREIALVMSLGILVDALLVRSVLVPAMLTLLGRFSVWPRRIAPERPSTPDRGG